MAAGILKAGLKVLGWTIEGLLGRLADRGQKIERTTFSNYLRPLNLDEPNPKRRNKGFPDDFRLIAAIVQVFVEDPPRKQRWSPAEALAFALAAGQPAEKLTKLAPLFEDAEVFARSYRALINDAQTQLHELAAETLNRLPLHRVPDRAPLPAHTFGVLPLANEQFVGRERELRDLAYLLRTTSALRLVLVGMPGLGKTALAVELILRYGQYFQGGVFFLVADSLARLQAELIALGHELLPGPQFIALPEAARLRAVRDALQVQPSCLLVIDNIDELDHDALAALLPDGGVCRVVLTSRQRPPFAGWQEYMLDPLRSGEATKLLLHLSGMPMLTDAAYLATAQQIASLVGDLPLALTLLGAYVRVQSEEHSAVLERLLIDLQQVEAIAHPALGGAGSLHRLDTLIGYFLNRLKTDHPIQGAARRLLALAAVFAPGQPLERALLRTIAATTAIDEERVIEPVPFFDDAFKELRSRSIFMQAADKQLSMHRVVRSYVRAQFALRPAVVQVAAAVYKQLVSDLPPDQQEMLEAIQRHDTLLRSLAEDGVRLAIEQAAEISYMLGWYLIRNSEHQAASYWTRTAVDLALQRFGRDHPVSAEAWCRLGLGCVLRNELAQARQAYAEMLAIQQQIYPEDHRERVVGYQNMAQALVIDGAYQESQRYIRKAFAVCRRWQAAADPQQRALATARIGRGLRILGQNAYEQGHYWRSYRYYWAAQRYQTHSQAFAMQLMHDRAYICILLGRYAEADKLLQAMLPTYHTIYANRIDEHGRIWHQNAVWMLKIVGDLALFTQAFTHAERQLREALSMGEVLLGPASLETAEPLESLGELFLQTGRYEEAGTYFIQALRIYEQLFPHSNQNKRARLWLRQARLALLQDKLDDAAHLCVAVRFACAELDLCGHPLELWAVALLAEIARRQGLPRLAQEHWAWALPRLRRVFPQHAIVQRLTQHQGTIFFNPLDTVIG